MKRLFDRVVNGFPRAKLAAVCLCVLFWLFVTKLCGAGLFDLFRFLLCAVFYVLLPGMLFSGLSEIEKELPDFRIPAAILFGAGFLAVLYCICMRMGWLPLLYVLPPVLGFAHLILSRDGLHPRRAALRFFSDGTHMTLLFLWGAALALYACILGLKNAHPLAAGTVTLNEDMLWNIGNANAFQIAFPPQDIRFSGVRFAYHYLTEMLWGILSLVSGTSAYDVFIFFSGPVFLGALIICLYALGLYFYGGGQRRALAFPVVLFGFGCLSLWGVFGIGSSIFSNRLLEHMVTNINAQATAFVFISIFFMLFAHMARQGYRVSWRYLVSTVCAFVLVCFAKGPQAAILICALAVVFFFSLARRPHYGKLLLFFAGCFACFTVIYLFVFSSGANTSMYFDWLTVIYYRSSETLIPLMDQIHLTGYPALFLLAVADVFCMVPFQFLLYLPVLLRDVRKLPWLPEGRLLAHGVCAGGFLAYHLFHHPNSSQIYFAYIAIFFMTLLAVDALSGRKKNLFGFLAGVCGALALTTTVLQCVVFAGSGLRNLAYDAGLAERPYSESYATAGDEEAMRWFRENTGADALFVTNRIDTRPGLGNGISSLYTAFSGRQAYMEGYAYAVSNMGVSEAVLREKQQTNAAFFSEENDAEKLACLAAENEITHAVFSKQFPGETTALSTFPIVYENDSVIIYELQ